MEERYSLFRPHTKLKGPFEEGLFERDYRIFRVDDRTYAVERLRDYGNIGNNIFLYQLSRGQTGHIRVRPIKSEQRRKAVIALVRAGVHYNTDSSLEEFVNETSH